jgi:guanylate kinase
VASYEEYDYVVVNDDLDACVMAMRSIILAERVRRERMRRKADTILKTFGVQPVA